MVWKVRKVLKVLQGCRINSSYRCRVLGWVTVALIS